MVIATHIKNKLYTCSKVDCLKTFFTSESINQDISYDSTCADDIIKNLNILPDRKTKNIKQKFIKQDIDLVYYLTSGDFDASDLHHIGKFYQKLLKTLKNNIIYNITLRIVSESNRFNYCSKEEHKKLVDVINDLEGFIAKLNELEKSFKSLSQATKMLRICVTKINFIKSFKYKVVDKVYYTRKQTLHACMLLMDNEKQKTTFHITNKVLDKKLEYLKLNDNTQIINLDKKMVLDVNKETKTKTKKRVKQLKKQDKILEPTDKT